MMNRDAAEKLVALITEIGTRLESVSSLIKDSSDEDEYETYLSTIEYVIGYLQQDVVDPIIANYPDLAPDDGK